MKLFSIKESLRWGFAQTKQSFAFFLGLSVILIFVTVFFSTLQESLKEGSILIEFLWALLSIVVETLLGMGVIYITLQCYERKKPTYTDLLKPSAQFLNYLVVSILYGIIVLIGFILLIIPGIIFWLKYRFATYLVIEKKMGPFAALQKSGEITRGEKWHLLRFTVVLFFLNLLGLLCLVVGLLVTIPMSYLATIFVYKKLLEHSEGKTMLKDEPMPVI